MRAYEDGNVEPGSHRQPCQCEIQASDTSLLIDAVTNIVLSVVTIAVLLLRHPFLTVVSAAMILFVGAVMGWW